LFSDLSFRLTCPFLFFDVPFFYLVRFSDRLFNTFFGADGFVSSLTLLPFPFLFFPIPPPIAMGSPPPPRGPNRSAYLIVGSASLSLFCVSLFHEFLPHLHFCSCSKPIMDSFCDQGGRSFIDVIPRVFFFFGVSSFSLLFFPFSLSFLFYSLSAPLLFPFPPFSLPLVIFHSIFFQIFLAFSQSRPALLYNRYRAVPFGT